jgi:uncharacterized protein
VIKVKRQFPKLIGVIHLPALPGDAHAIHQSYTMCYQHAMHDACALLEGGIEGIIIENFGSAPFHKGTRQDPAPPHQIAALSVVALKLRTLSKEIKIGINCLRNDAVAAIGIAAAVGADFIRVNVLSGAYVTDQGLIEGEAATLLRYRRQLGAEHIQIFADILVKHATPLAPLSPEQAALDTWKRGGADALIVSGNGTGEPVSEALLKQVQLTVQGEVPIYIGSGLSIQNTSTLAPFASGAIVGTALKEGGDLKAPVSAKRVQELKAKLSPYWSL